MCTVSTSTLGEREFGQDQNAQIYIWIGANLPSNGACFAPAQVRLLGEATGAGQAVPAAAAELCLDTSLST